MKINKQLLLIKAHYFFFMSAMGPILPQLSVYGRQMGISLVIMSAVTDLLPLAFLIANPLFGIVVDVYRNNYRKAIFMMLIFLMTISSALIALIPVLKPKWLGLIGGRMEDYFLDTCQFIDFTELDCQNHTKAVTCTSECFDHPGEFLMTNCNSQNFIDASYGSFLKLCSPDNETFPFLLGNTSCETKCIESIESNETDDSVLNQSITFWSFFILMSIGRIGYNVTKSISDAICFDVIGEDYDYGKQRVWGTIGFGTTALLSGYIVDLFSGHSISYIPAITVMVIFSLLDLICCFKLKLPIIEAPKNIIKDLKELMNDRQVITFMIVSILAGILDGFIIYFRFWYVQDLADATNTVNIKLVEGLIVAAEALGGEVIFFSISGKILERFGHVHCFSMCFVNYALRLALISLAPNPWWILPVELIFQGPTYALTYTTIVTYANELAPPGASATMQGIAAGIHDGIGYVIGIILGGLLYMYVNGKVAFQVFSALGVLCSIIHLVLHKTYLKSEEATVTLNGNSQVIYKSHEEAVKDTFLFMKD